MADSESPDGATRLLQREPIDRLTKPFVRFLHVESASGIVLLLATAVAVGCANSWLAGGYLAIWKTQVGIELGAFQFRHSLKHIINDGLMVLFFFVVGLEVKRELVLGELRDVRRAALPIAGAAGGMFVPAMLYLLVATESAARHGWGIPMATDIAFVVGCMAVLGSRVPASLRVMLLSLAIADDIGAILVIAFGYSTGISFVWLGAGLVGIAVVHIAARLGVRKFGPYALIGVCIWFAFHESGVHATIAGVILGLMTPARNYIPPEAVILLLQRAEDVLGGETGTAETHRVKRVRRLLWAAREVVSPLEYLESMLHPWVAFVIMPLFALANAGVRIDMAALSSNTALAVFVGLVVGKPIGIVLFSWLAVRLGIARLPECGWSMLAAGGCLAGIGFTMALFIAELAIAEPILTTAKVGVLAASLVSALMGTGLIVLFSKGPHAAQER